MRPGPRTCCHRFCSRKNKLLISYLWVRFDQRDVDDDLLPPVKDALVRLDYVEARLSRLHFVGEVASGHVAYLQVGLVLILGLVGLGRLETQLLVGVDLHYPREKSSLDLSI